MMLLSSLTFFLVVTSHQQHRSSSIHNHSSSTKLLSPLQADNEDKYEEHPSRWRRRTEKRRQRTEELLDSVEDGTFLHLTPTQPLVELQNLQIPTLQIPNTSTINWNTINPQLDPIQGGKLRQGTQRGLRKRAQVEAFHHLVSTFLDAKLQQLDDNISSYEEMDGVTIIDAGCGAGNLAISLAGIPYSSNINVNVLAVDVNDHALDRLTKRAQTILPPAKLETCCADLANYDLIQSKIPPNHSVIVVSLHACGAASDMAMNLAIRCKAPFVICPCCTAKSLTKRLPQDTGKRTTFDLSASFQRSGATSDIVYPRSNWLRNKLHDGDALAAMSLEEKYTILAKTADVGLGPQIPSQQRLQQSRAKKIVELDRLMAASEDYGYDVRLMRISGHDPLVYGKGELLIGGKEIADVLLTLSLAEDDNIK